MTVRTDVSVDWEASPRIITVASPSTEITIQDLVDTLRSLEDDVANMDDPHLVNAAGKEPLGGGVFVGITATLQNALLAFEARPGPTFELCRVSGGNLVAVDSLGAAVASPIQTTAFVQVVISASSSATTQSLSTLERTAFSGGVSFDALLGVAGTAYPIGTQGTPVNNLADAIVIGATYGLNVLYVNGIFATSPGDLLEEWTIVGSNAWTDHCHTIAGGSLIDCAFRQLHLMGDFGGTSVMHDCRIGTVIGTANGEMEGCKFEGSTVTLAAAGKLEIINCSNGSTGVAPVINQNGDGNVYVRHYSGDLTLSGLTAGRSEVDLYGGDLTLDNTNTGGEIYCSGNGYLIDNSAGSTVDNQMSGTQAIWDFVPTNMPIGSVGQLMIDNAKILRNKTVTDPVAGTITVFDDDGTTVLFTANLWENVAGTTAYQGQGANRRERLA